MRQLTLWQPWASLLAHGVKTIETRSWGTSYRGDVLITAAKKFDAESRFFAEDQHVAKALLRLGYKTPDDLPFGKCLAMLTLVDCLQITPENASDLWSNNKLGSYVLSEDEFEYGNLNVGRFAWVFDGGYCFEPWPFPVVGKQGLREPDEMTAHNAAQAVLEHSYRPWTRTNSRTNVSTRG